MNAKRTQQQTSAQRAARAARPRVRTRTNGSAMHPITFCVSCMEAIPLRALTCFHCGAKQPHGEDAVEVVFCEKCGEDYPARSMACHHCGHVNPRHPLMKGRIAS